MESLYHVINLGIGLVMLVGGLIILNGYRGRRKARQSLLANGIRTTGIITGTTVALSMSGTNMYEVAYKYTARTRTGQDVEIQAPEPLLVDPRTLQALQQGKLELIYDPDKPENVMLADKSLGGGYDKLVRLLCVAALVIGLFLTVYALSGFSG
ncbi:MAG: DUF3592 domain-containing protein [Chloroflexota bacterium]